MSAALAPAIGDDRSRLVVRALTALNPDRERRSAAARSLRAIAAMVDEADMVALVESIERASADINRQLLLERYGQVTCRG